MAGNRGIEFGRARGAYRATIARMAGNTLKFDESIVATVSRRARVGVELPCMDPIPCRSGIMIWSPLIRLGG
jgi:hypothetical protein